MARKTRKALVGVGSGNNQRGNLNALRSGSRIPMRRLVVGSVGIKPADDETKEYRRNLEAVVLCDKGLASTEQIVAVYNEAFATKETWTLWQDFVETHIEAEDRHLISLASACTATIEVNRWLLRRRAEYKLSAAEIGNRSDTIIKAEKERLEAIRQLNLNAEPEPVTLKGYVIEAGRNGQASNTK